MSEFKSGFVTIIGRTNVGKSTLINLLVGEKIAAIANKVQTTRTAIKGIVNRDSSQIIFTDRMINTGSVNDQPRGHCMRSQMVSS